MRLHVRHWRWGLALAPLTAVHPPTPLTAQSAPVAFQNARIIPVVGAEIPRGTVVIQNGKIIAIGANVPVPSGAQVVDA
ncbi:MAG: hypothetical protein JF590_00265, partial [Gemmatimonadetes bacterium]|nr:hypothetical protein [Gemmatimonadota bacterium]